MQHHSIVKVWKQPKSHQLMNGPRKHSNKKWPLCGRTEVFARTTVVIVLRHLNISNQHRVHLELIQYLCQVYVSKRKKKNEWMNEKKRGKNEEVICIHIDTHTHIVSLIGQSCTALSGGYRIPGAPAQGWLRRPKHRAGREFSAGAGRSVQASPCRAVCRGGPGAEMAARLCLLLLLFLSFLSFISFYCIFWAQLVPRRLCSWYLLS